MTPPAESVKRESQAMALPVGSLGSWMDALRIHERFRESGASSEVPLNTSEPSCSVARNPSTLGPPVTIGATLIGLALRSPDGTDSAGAVGPTPQPETVSASTQTRIIDFALTTGLASDDVVGARRAREE